jgi:hypothetical protein
VHARWNTVPAGGELRPVAEQIEEAPIDIVTSMGRAYIATGRGGRIEAFSWSTGPNTERWQLTPPTPEAFKPARMAVAGRHLVVSSYAQIFVWDNERYVGEESVGSASDCIDGLSAIGEGAVVFSLTYSNRLFHKRLPEGESQEIQVEGSAPDQLTMPCWITTDPTVEGRFFVADLQDGNFGAIEIIS